MVGTDHALSLISLIERGVTVKECRVEFDVVAGLGLNIHAQ